MAYPQINTPSMVCAIPDGRVLVAEHALSNVGGHTPIDRILCIHPDGKVNIFADGLYAVFGLAYLDGKVYVRAGRDGFGPLWRFATVAAQALGLWVHVSADEAEATRQETDLL